MRLDDVKEILGDQIQIAWKSFMLRPTPDQARGRDQFVKYTQSWERILEQDERLEITTPWGSADDPPSHSMPALAASKLTKTYGQEIDEKFHNLVFQAYFRDNRTISDAAVLADLAGAAGLDSVQFAADFEAQGRILSNQVIEDHNRAISLGISAVPTVVLNDDLAIPGAQDVDTYVRAIKDALIS